MTKLAGALPLALMVVAGAWAVAFIVYGVYRMVEGLPVCGM